MKKASSSLLVLIFAALLVSFPSFAQLQVDRRIIHERVAQSIRSYERLRLLDLLRLSHHESHLEIGSLSLLAEGIKHGPVELQLLQFGRPIATEIIPRNGREVRIGLPPMTKISELELAVSEDIYLERLSVEVEEHRPHGPFPGNEQQVQPQAFLTLHLNRHIRGPMQLHLGQLVREQLGLSLEGAQIERVVVQGQPSGSNRSASVQIRLNHRLSSPVKYLSPGQGRMPIPLHTSEEVRSLELLINGDAFIQTVSIRVGQVRPIRPERPHQNRFNINQEIRPYQSLELSRLLGYDSRLITSITVEARSLRGLQAQIMLMGPYNDFQGSVILGQHSSRATLHLRRPMPAHELKLESHSPALIESIEVTFDHYRRY